MIIRIFKISTKEMYTFKNKMELFNFVKEAVDAPIFYNKTIPQIIACLPVEDYCRAT
jgi:hypothetical protein